MPLSIKAGNRRHDTPETSVQPAIEKVPWYRCFTCISRSCRTRCEWPLLAEDRLLPQFAERLLLWRKPTLKLGEAAAKTTWSCQYAMSLFM